jgi:hypothetical protein
VKVNIDIVPIASSGGQRALSLHPEGFMDFDGVFAIGPGWYTPTTENLRNVIAILRLAGVEVELTSHAQRLLEEKP